MGSPAGIRNHPIHPIAIAILAVSGWLGGSLVCVHGVAVEASTEEHKRAG